MLRFILSKETRNQGYVGKDLCTLDVDCPQLEKILRSGGYGAGPDGDDFEHTILVGVEVLHGGN